MSAPGAAAMPAAEIDVTADLVAELLRAQHPDVAGLPLRRVANGWDNVVFRLGPDLAVRVPRRQLGVRCLQSELDWLPVISPGLPLAVPEVIFAGRPGPRYPWPWLVCRWVPGRTALQAPPDDALVAAESLAQFQRQLHRTAPAGAPRNPVRGIPLALRAGYLQQARAALPGLWTGHLAAIWEVALAAPPPAGPARWLHGDPHPGNLITRNGQLVGVIDFGDLCAGDPATDLAVAWLALPRTAHDPLRQHADELGPGTWQRARGWALALAMAIAANTADDPQLARVARDTLARLSDEPL